MVSASDTIIEAAGEGIDTVITAMVGYTLAANVENLVHTGSANFAGFGNALDNILTGSSARDTLAGKGGNDTLIGGDGLDTADFTGIQTDYEIVKLADGRYRVTDLVGGRDGVDLLDGIAQVRFSNGYVVTLALASIPMAGAPAPAKSAGPLVLPGLDDDGFLPLAPESHRLGLSPIQDDLPSTWSGLPLDPALVLDPGSWTPDDGSGYTEGGIVLHGDTDGWLL